MTAVVDPRQRHRGGSNLVYGRIGVMGHCFNHGRLGCRRCGERKIDMPVMRCGYLIGCAYHGRSNCTTCFYKRDSKRVFGPKRFRGVARGSIRAGSIANVQLREFVLREMRFVPELTFEEIAQRAGYCRHSGAGDSTYVKRAIGLSPDTGTQECRAGITEEAAVRIARAIHVDPWEIGL